MGRQRGKAWLSVALVAVMLFSLALAATVGAATPRVPQAFFGVGFQRGYQVSQTVRDRWAAGIEQAGIEEARVPIPWSMIEPQAPTNAGHTYRWAGTDAVILSLAKHDIRAQPFLAYAPPWASNATSAEITACRQSGAMGLAAGSPKAYAAAIQAVARRYGPNGAFWAAHPDLAPNPTRFYEVWNAPNTRGAWCPQTDPEGYGLMFERAADAIHEVDPQAFVTIGGMGLGAKTQNGSVSTPEFLNRMVNANPSLASIPRMMAGLHMYPDKTLSGQLKGLPLFRGWMRNAGLADSVPITVNEIGFSRGGDLDYTEPERVASYRNVTSQLPRTNCNVMGMLAYTWTTTEQGSGAEAWFGIASPATGQPYDSGQEFSYWVNLFLGRFQDEAPRTTIDLCPGMPLPDLDGDGVPDETDNFPLNAAKS